MGSAAAMQALKMFTGGSSGNSSGGNSQNAFIGMAMGQASKLFDSQASQGNVSSGASKESAIQKAGESMCREIRRDVCDRALTFYSGIEDVYAV